MFLKLMFTLILAFLLTVSAPTVFGASTPRPMPMAEVAATFRDLGYGVTEIRFRKPMAEAQIKGVKEFLLRTFPGSEIYMEFVGDPKLSGGAIVTYIVIHR